MNGRKLWYFVLCVALALLPLAGCSSGGSGGVGSVSTGEKGTSLTVQGSVDPGKSTGKSVLAASDPLSGTVSVLDANAAGEATRVLGTATIGADGKFSGLSFTLPAVKSVIIFRADTNKSFTPFYAVVPIDLSNPPAAGITASNAIVILINEASTNTASIVSSGLGFSGVLPNANVSPAIASGMLGDAGNLIPTGKTFTDVALLVTQYGGQVLAYNTSGLNLTGSLNTSLLPAQDANTMTGDELLSMTLNGQITGVSIPGNNPIVSFQVTNKATGKGIRGLKSFGLAIAQLKPAANGAPSEWLSYMIASSTSRPGTDAATTYKTDGSINVQGYTVIDNGDGSYTAKFARNIKAVTQVPYDATRTHRVAVQVRTAPVAALTSTGTSVSNFRTEKILFYDFVPATPTVAPTEQRNIVKTEACVACHTKLGVTTPHGGRGDVRYCMMCHNAQRANGQTPSTSVGGVFTGTTYVADGEVSGDMVVMIHKIHMGEELTKKGYNYANVLFNEVLYPMPITNCTSCHIEDTATAAQALNWKDKPSRKACGSCHDNITWATGVNSKAGGTNHTPMADDSNCIGCHGSASTVYAAKVHMRVLPPDPNSPEMGGTNTHTYAGYLPAAGAAPTGAAVITWDIASVTRDASKRPVINFKFKKDGADVVFNTYAAGSVTEMMNGFVGSPSAYFVFSVPQDGITAPADYNASASSFIKAIWNGTATGTKAGTLTGPDGSGYYTLTLTGVAIPDNASMLTGGIGYTYGSSSTPLTQIDLPAYPYTAATNVGGLMTTAPNVWKVATGYTGRRIIVDNAKCNACHGKLGVAPTYHSGQRNDAPTCTFCHTANRTNSGWPVNINYDVHSLHGAAMRTNKFSWEASAGAKFWNVKYPGILNNCEGCHITGMYDFSANVNPGHGAPVIYTYTPQLLSSLLMTTAASGTIKKVGDTVSTSDTRLIASVGVATTGTETFDALNLAISPFVTAGTAYGSGFAVNSSTFAPTDAAATTLVLSPISAACSGCHDTKTARAHMQANGGTVYGPRSDALANTEQCLICHGVGKTADIKAVHAWK